MRKLNIFGMTVVIKRKSLREQGFAGLYDPVACEITLDKELKGNDLLQTELHEFFHACINRLSMNQTNIGANLQEIICDSFATALVENYKIKPK